MFLTGAIGFVCCRLNIGDFFGKGISMIPLQKLISRNPGTAVSCIFMADAHLRDPHEAHYQVVKEFLSRLKGPDTMRSGTTASPLAFPDHLFIAGDFFDFWFSRRGKIYPGFRDVVSILTRLQREGVTVHFCEGNHDFFMKSYFADFLGMNVYEDWAGFVLEDRKVLLSHGDLVDVDNHHYLRLRRFLRSRGFVRLQRLLPLQLLWMLARKSSQTSQEYMGGAKDAIAAKMEAFAGERYREGYDTVILGHCHKAQLKEIDWGGRVRTFATLGDWLTECTYLHYQSRRFRLCRYEGAGAGINLDTQAGVC